VKGRVNQSKMQVTWTGWIVFVGFCVLLWVVVSRPVWMPLGEAIATVLILLGLAGLLVPRVRTKRDV
jgi:hypothetical protein